MHWINGCCAIAYHQATNNWSFAAIFGNRHPVIMEIGFGNGNLLAEQATRYPEINFIGVEVYRPGIGRLLQQLEKHENHNVRILTQDAVEVLSCQIAPDSLFAIWLFFPDPWPKKRHHKRRILNQQFLDLAASATQSGGILHFATDWQDYAQQTRATINKHPQFSLASGFDLSNYPFTGRPLTHFEQRGKHKGHSIDDIYAKVVKDHLGQAMNKTAKGNLGKMAVPLPLSSTHHKPNRWNENGSVEYKQHA